MSESFTDFTWLYRGVPVESPEVRQVKFDKEVNPPRPDRVGDEWRAEHMSGRTLTGYTSWTSDRSFAEEAAWAQSEFENLSGLIRIFRVRTENLIAAHVFEGRADEGEYLIEGLVEQVEFSEDTSDEEDD